MPEEDIEITATEFKATCLNLLDRLAARKLTRLVVTKRGRPVAIITPADSNDAAEELFGCMRGSVSVPTGVDLAAPVLDKPIFAEEGRVRS